MNFFRDPAPRINKISYTQNTNQCTLPQPNCQPEHPRSQTDAVAFTQKFLRQIFTSNNDSRFVCVAKKKCHQWLLSIPKTLNIIHNKNITVFPIITHQRAKTLSQPKEKISNHKIARVFSPQNPRGQSLTPNNFDSKKHSADFLIIANFYQGK